MKLFIHENAFENAKWQPFCPGGGGGGVVVKPGTILVILSKSQNWPLGDFNDILDE